MTKFLVSRFSLMMSVISGSVYCFGSPVFGAWDGVNWKVPSGGFSVPANASPISFEYHWITSFQGLSPMVKAISRSFFGAGVLSAFESLLGLSSLGVSGSLGNSIFGASLGSWTSGGSAAHAIPPAMPVASAAPRNDRTQRCGQKYFQGVLDMCGHSPRQGGAGPHDRARTHGTAGRSPAGVIATFGTTRPNSSD